MRASGRGSHVHFKVSKPVLPLGPLLKRYRQISSHTFPWLRFDFRDVDVWVTKLVLRLLAQVLQDRGGGYFF